MKLNMNRIASRKQRLAARIGDALPFGQPVGMEFTDLMPPQPEDIAALRRNSTIWL